MVTLSYGDIVFWVIVLVCLAFATWQGALNRGYVGGLRKGKEIWFAEGKAAGRREFLASPLRPEELARCVAEEGAMCPRCSDQGSMEYGGPKFVDGNKINPIQDLSCDVCGKKWRLHFKVNQVTELPQD